MIYFQTVLICNGLCSLAVWRIDVPVTAAAVAPTEEQWKRSGGEGTRSGKAPQWDTLNCIRKRPFVFSFQNSGLSEEACIHLKRFETTE